MKARKAAIEKFLKDCENEGWHLCSEVRGFPGSVLAQMKTSEEERRQIVGNFIKMLEKEEAEADGVSKPRRKKTSKAKPAEKG